MQMFENLLEETGAAQWNRLRGVRVRVTGVGFFDLSHFQVGRSRSCMELHPVLAIEKLLASPPAFVPSRPRPPARTQATISDASRNDPRRSPAHGRHPQPRPIHDAGTRDRRARIRPSRSDPRAGARAGSDAAAARPRLSRGRPRAAVPLARRRGGCIHQLRVRHAIAARADASARGRVALALAPEHASPVRARLRA